jgi:hypothetical protein
VTNLLSHGTAQIELVNIINKQSRISHGNDKDGNGAGDEKNDKMIAYTT